MIRKSSTKLFGKKHLCSEQPRDQFKLQFRSYLFGLLVQGRHVINQLCSKHRSSCQCVNVSPCLRVSLHEGPQRNDGSFAMLTVLMIVIIQLMWSLEVPHAQIESVAGTWRMNRVLRPNPTVEDRAYWVGDHVILRRIHPHKWKVTKNRFFMPKAEKWRWPPQTSYYLR